MVLRGENLSQNLFQFFYLYLDHLCPVLVCRLLCLFGDQPCKTKTAVIGMLVVMLVMMIEALVVVIVTT